MPLYALPEAASTTPFAGKLTIVPFDNEALPPAEAETVPAIAFLSSFITTWLVPEVAEKERRPLKYPAFSAVTSAVFLSSEAFAILKYPVAEAVLRTGSPTGTVH